MRDLTLTLAHDNTLDSSCLRLSALSPSFIYVHTAKHDGSTPTNPFAYLPWGQLASGPSPRMRRRHPGKGGVYTLKR